MASPLEQPVQRVLSIGGRRRSLQINVRSNILRSFRSSSTTSILHATLAFLTFFDSYLIISTYLRGCWEEPENLLRKAGEVKLSAISWLLQLNLLNYRLSYRGPGDWSLAKLNSDDIITDGRGGDGMLKKRWLWIIPLVLVLAAGGISPIKPGLRPKRWWRRRVSAKRPRRSETSRSQPRTGHRFPQK